MLYVLKLIISNYRVYMHCRDFETRDDKSATGHILF